MKICFLSSICIDNKRNLYFPDTKTLMNRGSYRIHVHDLCHYINKYTDSVAAINSFDMHSYDVVILDKSICNNTQIFKKVCSEAKNKIIGVITPPAIQNKWWNKINFTIVGSCEEKESLLKYCKHNFIFPQIELKYLSCSPKIHIDKKEIIIGYHGNVNHLNHMNLGLCKAIERLAKEVPLELHIVTNNNLKDWKQGRPKVKTVIKQWDIDKVEKDIQLMDIGIVPNISDFNNKLLQKNGPFKSNIVLGKYNTDLIIRFKNKSNIGRSLVFFQLGIPVVADITPSNMHIFADPDNGYAVLSEEGWYLAMKELVDYKRRNFISQNAFKEYKEKYNPSKWSNLLVKNIKKLL